MVAAFGIGFGTHDDDHDNVPSSLADDHVLVNVVVIVVATSHQSIWR